MKVLGNKHCLTILCELHQGEHTVTALARALDLRQPVLSRNLARLRSKALVRARREGRRVFYSLADPDVERIIALLYQRHCAERNRKIYPSFDREA